ncbi:YDG/SRA domain-containing protein [Streptomyces sp. SAS_270]|uniref:YDG/SRA domain-containing protein n=1 Tax=Streptomyces sp. SAS_270 TaxID=3412748 RepID=UPI00403CD563
MEIERAIGHISGIPLGAVFHRRLDVMRAQLHRTNQKGISWIADEDGAEVGDAIVLHGGYEDDEDHWTWVRYTGASPDKEKDEKTGKLLCSQSWAYRDNAALKRSYERGHPIRVIRGYEGDPRFSLPDDYRYDGLYKITAIRTAISKSPAPDGSELKICQFDLARLSDPLQEQTDVERHVAEMLEELDGLDELSGQQEAEKFPEVRTTQVQRFVRDAPAARRIKELYEGECQLCGLRLMGPDGKPYSEGAHIRPLGRPHNGPDVEPNILCLCPNCHVRLDIGAVVVADDWSIVVRAGLLGAPVLPRLLMKGQHRVHPDYVRYHRAWWEKNTGPASDS